MLRLAVWWLVVCMTVWGIEFRELDEEARNKLFGIVQVETVFEKMDVPMRGLGTIIGGQYVLTSSHLVFDHEINDYAQRIRVRVQDTLDSPSICFAEMEVAALDSVRQLALLQSRSFTDVFCNPINDPSEFHLNYFKKHSIGLLDQAADPFCPMVQDINKTVYFPYYPDNWKEIIHLKSAQITEQVIRSDDEGNQYVVGYQSDISFSAKDTGSGVLDSSFRLTGLAHYRELPLKKFEQRIISKPVLVGWFCRLSENGIAELSVMQGEKSIPLYQTQMCKTFKQERVFYDPW